MTVLDYTACVVAAFLCFVGVDEFRQYRNKVEACRAIEAVVLSVGRELAPAHPCRPYL